MIGNGMRAQRKQTTSRERGTVLTEFVMVAPVMLLIAGSALRFYQELQAQEVGVTLAREIATMAYNQCVDKTLFTVTRQGTTTQDVVSVDKVNTEAEITKCLTTVQSTFSDAWNNGARPITGSMTVEIRIEVHRCNITEILPTDCSTKSIVTVGSLTGSPPVLTTFRNRLTYAKIRFEVTPITSFIPSIASRSVTYEATV